MTVTGGSDPKPLDIREQIARIDHMLADHGRIGIDIERIIADRDRKRQEIRFAAWQIGLTLMTAGAAFFAAGVAFIKVLAP